MAIKFNIEPAIQVNQPYLLDIKAMSNAVRANKKEMPIYISDAFDKIQASVNIIQNVLRRSQTNSINELLITDRNGALIGWIGARPPYFGAWFKQLYVGSTGPDTAPFFADQNGDVIIGKNGSLALQDGGGNEVGWLGVQADAAKVITGATNATPVVVTIAGHGYENGDTVFISGVGGNTATNGYRIVQAVAANTFEITDLDGVDVAGNGAYTTGGTAIRYFGGGRFQTIAVGASFTNYKLRAYADGQLKIKDALITLTDVANNGYIELNPSTGPDAIFRNTFTGQQVRIFEGVLYGNNSAGTGETSEFSKDGLVVRNSSGNANVSVFSTGGGSGTGSVYVRNSSGTEKVSLTASSGNGLISIYSAGGVNTISLAGSSGNVSSTNVDVSNEYRVGGVPGIGNVMVVPTSLSVGTASAVISVDFGASTTVSGTFVQTVTFTNVTITHTKGILTDAV